MQLPKIQSKLFPFQYEKHVFKTLRQQLNQTSDDQNQADPVGN